MASASCDTTMRPGKVTTDTRNGIETPLEFVDLNGLLADFWKEVGEWMAQNEP